jgi:uncharacterized membrane protein YhhN
MPAYIYILPAVVVFVSCLVYFELKKKRGGIFVTKPISTILLIVCALLSLTGTAFRCDYTALIVLGLLFSLGGDVALMFQEKRGPFLIGLVLFLLAHVVYGGTFLKFGGVESALLWIGLVWLVPGIVIYIYLFPGLGKMKVSVALYVLIITFMATAATATLWSDGFPGTAALFVTVGSILFYLSDVILAVNRFRYPMRFNRLSLIPYYLGQLLIAVSTYYFGGA